MRASLLRKEGQEDSICTITDISLGGAKIAGSPPAWARNREEGVLLLDGGALRVPFRFIGLDRRPDFGRGFPIVFEAGIPLRRTLTARLFGGAYRGAIDDIDAARDFRPRQAAHEMKRAGRLAKKARSDQACLAFPSGAGSGQ
jgi:hypothetical protein